MRIVTRSNYGSGYWPPLYMVLMPLVLGTGRNYVVTKDIFRGLARGNYQFFHSEFFPVFSVIFFLKWYCFPAPMVPGTASLVHFNCHHPPKWKVEFSIPIQTSYRHFA